MLSTCVDLELLELGATELGVGNHALDGLLDGALRAGGQQLVRAPFTILDLEGRFDVVARINGGGVSGQAGALRLGIARALNEIDREANRATLKKAGFLTRDSRIVERKKAGLHKARRAPQYSKR